MMQSKLWKRMWQQHAQSLVARYSTKKKKISFFDIIRHQRILEVAKCAHEQQGFPRWTYLTPHKYSVPAKHPWPEELHKFEFDLSKFREEKRNGRISDDIVKQLDAMGFVWERATYQWEQNLVGLEIYKELYGDLLVPQRFRIPSGDTKWPSELWNKRLGAVVGHLRNQASTLPPVRRELLNSMGFVWDATEERWQRNLLAIRTYLSIHGDLNVPFKFVIPKDDPAWPVKVWGLRLGKMLGYLRQDKNALTQERQKVLSELGLIGKIREKGAGPCKPPTISTSRQREIAKIAQTIRRNQGHDIFTTISPAIFRVPASEAWPSELHNIKVNVSEFRRAYNLGLLDPTIAGELDAIDFVWDTSLHQWRTNLEAMERYQEIHGDLLVHKHYIVPDNDPNWPVYHWKKQLGHVVDNIRQNESKISDERREALNKLGFVWNTVQNDWKRNVFALGTFRNIFGHLRVPKRFVIPDQDPAWPSELWNVNLGNVVHNIRRKRDSFTASRLEELDAIGFVWRGTRS